MIARPMRPTSPSARPTCGRSRRRGRVHRPLGEQAQREEADQHHVRRAPRGSSMPFGHPQPVLATSRGSPRGSGCRRRACRRSASSRRPTRRRCRRRPAVAGGGAGREEGVHQEAPPLSAPPRPAVSGGEIGCRLEVEQRLGRHDRGRRRRSCRPAPARSCPTRGCGHPTGCRLLASALADEPPTPSRAGITSPANASTSRNIRAWPAAASVLRSSPGPSLLYTAADRRLVGEAGDEIRDRGERARRGARAGPDRPPPWWAACDR